MNSDDKVVLKIVGVIAIIMIVGIFFEHIETMDEIGTARIDTCITAVNQAIPDPNETEERSAFLEACYNN